TRPPSRTRLNRGRHGCDVPWPRTVAIPGLSAFDLLVVTFCFAFPGSPGGGAPVADVWLSAADAGWNRPRGGPGVVASFLPGVFCGLQLMAVCGVTWLPGQLTWFRTFVPGSGSFADVPAGVGMFALLAVDVPGVPGPVREPLPQAGYILRAEHAHSGERHLRKLVQPLGGVGEVRPAQPGIHAPGEADQLGRTPALQQIRSVSKVADPRAAGQ